MNNTAQDLYVDHLHGAQGTTEKIKKAMYESAKQFVYIGFLLKEVKEHKYYEEGGYKDVYAYAEQELNFKRTSTKNFIAIAETFGVQEIRCGRIIDQKQTMHLQPKYEKFNYGQLVELLAMKEKQREQATPDMTVRQLRDLKKEVPAKTEAQTIGQTSDQPGKLQEPTIEEIEKENERLKNLYCTEANLAEINGETSEVTHYIMQELCRLAGMKYIDWEDYEITIKIKEEVNPITYSQGHKIQLSAGTIKEICKAIPIAYNPHQAFNIYAYWG